MNETLLVTFSRRGTVIGKIWQVDILHSEKEHGLHFIPEFSPSKDIRHGDFGIFYC